MNYELVTLEKKQVAGIRERTNNSAPDMQKKIGGLWKALFEEGLYQQIPNKTTGKALGLYTNYESDFTGDYDAGVGCEISSAEGLSEEMTLFEIPAGNYARFTVKGEIAAIAAFWGELWKSGLKRSYRCDFEEYAGEEGEAQESEIFIYIGIC